MSGAPLTTGAPAAPEPLLVDARTAAGMLSVSERLLWSWTKAGEIGVVRIGKRVLYPVQGLRDWVAALTVGGPVMNAPASIETPSPHDLKHPQGGPPVRPPTGTNSPDVEGDH
jgi:hypothetical protein